MMGSVGEFFKQARESQGLSLEDITSTTKIQYKYLQALEEENFSELPEQVFTKGFVRTYARVLGVDEEEALQCFSDTVGSFYQKDEDNKRQVQKQIEQDRRGKLNRNIVMAITGVVLIGLIYLLPQEQSAPLVPRSLSSVNTDTKNVSPAHATASSSSVGSVEESSTLKTASHENGRESVSEKRSVQAVRGAQGLILELEAMEVTWVVVRSDDGEPHEALLQSGETAIWKASERFFVTLGNAGGVLVKVNGESRGPFGKQGVVIRDLEIVP